jgi:hypothetical protein
VNVAADTQVEPVSSCNAGDTAISGGDVPTGLSYNIVASELAEYHTEWSGPANSNQWDWLFNNSSTDSISMNFTVFCQPG